MIGYYVHHHGAGHLARARCIAAATELPVVALSSVPAPVTVDPFAAWVELPRDDVAGDLGVDPGAGGALHWAPQRSSGYTRRMARLAEWARDTRPSAVVVDASVEVAALMRLLGLPVVLVAAPGTRDDRPHRLAHRLATCVLAPWTAEILEPPHLRAWVDKVVHCGAISRFDGRGASGSARRSEAGDVLVLMGAGGSTFGAQELEVARRATPGRRWRTLGVDGWADGDDVWSELSACDVVVCHGGQNVLAEVAAARRPAVVIPQDRPFDEQRVTASALAGAGVIVTTGPPAAAEWPDLLDRAWELDAGRWARWSLGDGARRAAEAVEAVVAAGTEPRNVETDHT